MCEKRSKINVLQINYPKNAECVTSLMVALVVNVFSFPHTERVAHDKS